MMIEQKETQLHTYHELTRKLLHSFVQGKEDDIASLLETREECITVINKLDEAAGKILMNNAIGERLIELIELEKDIRKHMEQSLKRLANQVQFSQNEQYLMKQYEDQHAVSKGIFYDRSK